MEDSKVMAHIGFRTGIAMKATGSIILGMVLVPSSGLMAASMRECGSTVSYKDRVPSLGQMEILMKDNLTIIGVTVLGSNSIKKVDQGILAIG